MASVVLQRRPKTRKGKKALQEKAPQLNEVVKEALFLRGGKCSEVVKSVMRDLYNIKKPHAIMFSRKNQIRPFEDVSSLEFFATKTACGLFVFGSHTKKRPHNLIMGRFFDNQVLDMFEFAIRNCKTAQSFQSNIQMDMGHKPCLVFQGEGFAQNVTGSVIRNFFLDFLRGVDATSINLKGLSSVIILSSKDGKEINFRHYAVCLKKSGQKQPRVELEEIGPRFDMVIRRTRLAGDELRSISLKQPKDTDKKPKNKRANPYGETEGTVHVQQQDLSTIALKKMKGLRKKKQKVEQDHHPTDFEK